ncbi:MAG TPA: helix-turn-helix transcriptional regulator [Planctomicrobium sp.]|nr:helix-turn-helix transcriptional regulator [Planctomicrobium sp.]
MTKWIRGKEIQAVFEILGECRELGDDPVIWREHLFAGLGKLVSADIVMGGELSGCLHGPLTNLGTADWGWGDGFDRIGWIRALELFNQNPFDHPLFKGIVEQLPGQNGATARRNRLLDDKEWYRSDVYEAIHLAAGIDHTMHSWHQVAPGADHHSGWILNRATGRRRFSQNEQLVVEYLHSQTALLVGGPLAQFHEPSPSELAPRVRQVLRCILEGDSDKQIAFRLELSHHTVNQYVKTIFRHFHVNSRAELMARWLRRGWTNKCVWTE